MSENKISKLLAAYDQAKVRFKEESDNLDKLTTELTTLRDAQSHVQGITSAVQQKVHERVSTLVSRCLSAVFDDPYEFKVVFERKRGKTEARLVFVRDGHEFDPIDGVGQGCVEVAALALRLVKLLSQPDQRRVLILDEPFKSLHGDNERQRVLRLVEMLAEELKVQFIITTGLNWLRVGKVIDLTA